MIGLSGAVRVLVATRPVDFRKGTEGLAALVRDVIGADPFDGAIYVFRAKRADRVKLVFWDGTGVCLFAKRLEDGRFQWPKIENGVMRLSAAQLSALVEGLDWRRAGKRRATEPRSAPRRQLTRRPAWRHPPQFYGEPADARRTIAAALARGGVRRG